MVDSGKPEEPRGDPFKLAPGGSFDVMHRTIMANAPTFVVLEAPSGRLHPVFKGTNLATMCSTHVYLGDAINEAYLLLRRSLRLECSILELSKRHNSVTM